MAQSRLCEPRLSVFIRAKCPLLQTKGEACRECVEKKDYVAKIRQVFGVAARDEL